jgi:RimJ/RimL family protein N-acetyltransferase
MTQIHQLETPRLLLRQWQADDREPFARMSADPEVMRWFPALLSRAESDAVADRISGLIESRRWGFWAVEIKSSRAFAGFVGLHRPIDEMPFSPCVEIGWRLSRAAWGQGIATEAAYRALAFGFHTLALTEIVSFAVVQNLRSIAVMQRLGMMADADTFMHPGLPDDSPLREHCLYRISRETFEQTVRTNQPRQP